MNYPDVGESVEIHSYKHDEQIHRIWNKATVLEVTDGMLITITNNRTKVYESDGRIWYTREPAIVYFFEDFWFNVTGMIRKDGIYYYCNLSSPFVFDGDAIKYIDYDLDVKVYPDRNYRILDRDEFNQHKRKYDYPIEIELIIEKQLKKLTEMIRNQEGPFAPGFVKYWYGVYKKKFNWR